jgi:hypothetical protein
MRPLERSLVATPSLRPNTVLICLRNASDRASIGSTPGGLSDHAPCPTTTLQRVETLPVHLEAYRDHVPPALLTQIRALAASLRGVTGADP